MDAGHVLSNFPTIVENIFKYFSLRELDCCAEVCDLWKRVAETEKNRREDIVVYFKVLPCTYHEKVHSNFEIECSLNMRGDLESYLSEQLKEIKIKPTFCLTFASSYLFDNFEQFFPSFNFSSSPKAKKQKKDSVQKSSHMEAVIQTAVAQYLPDKCCTAFNVAPGIIGCNNDLLPLEIENGCGITSILIPSVPGLKIFHIAVEDKNVDVSQIIPEDLEVKCLLAFMTDAVPRWLKLMRHCLTRQESKVALGGCLIDHSESGHGSYVAFCGPSVEAASIVMKPKYREAEVEKKLMSFKDTGLLKDRCFAFMFSCVGRGHTAYKKYNVESSIFHKLYPDVPLIGVFGNGEIGFDYVPNIAQREHRKPARRDIKKLRCGKIMHGYTTIFVLVSLRL